MSLGAGIVVALAVAVSAAGWWALAGLVVAAAVDRLGRRYADVASDRTARALRVVSRSGLVVVFCAASAAYLVPAGAGPWRAITAGLAAGGVVVAAALGVRPGVTARRVAAAVLLAAAAVFVAVCLAVPPPAPLHAGGATVPPVSGWVVAVGAFLPLFAVSRGRGTAIELLVALAVGAAALHQLGPVRLGLSVTSLKDVLVAADAPELTSALLVVVLSAAVAAAVDAAYDARPHQRRTGAPGAPPVRSVVAATAPTALGVGVAAALLPAATALALAAAVRVAELAYGAVARARGEIGRARR